jgi:lipopolysaccharide biosynthesis glycosyltransferase
MDHLDDPYIIHYFSGTKPWNEPDRPNADKFWLYARKTPFYEMMLLKMVSKNIVTNAQTGVLHVLEADAQEIPPHKRTRFYYNKYRLLSIITVGKLHKKYNARRKAVKKALGIR